MLRTAHAAAADQPAADPPAAGRRTAVATAGLVGATALLLAAPALAGGGTQASGELVRYENAPPVAATAPEGASARVHSVETGNGRLRVTLHVSGLQPLTRYGAHAHTSPCGPTGADAGPHYQFDLDPVSPSVDPAYANPRNEIWLDLTTGPSGQGHASAVLDQRFPDGRRPQSVILHERHTATAAGVAGVAGKRVACLPVPF